MQPAATRPVSQLAAPVTPRVRSRGLEHRQLTSGPGTCRGAPALLDHPCAEREAVTDGQLQKLRLITAIKTPYLTTGRFDLRAFDSIVEHQARTMHASSSAYPRGIPFYARQTIAQCLQIANGVDGLIIGGTTGEGQLMSWDEHIMLIAHTVNR